MPSIRILFFLLILFASYFQSIPTALATGNLPDLFRRHLSDSLLVELDANLAGILKNVDEGKTLELCGQQLDQIRLYLDEEIASQNLTSETKAEALRLNSIVKALLFRKFDGGKLLGSSAYRDIRQAWDLCSHCQKVNYGFGLTNLAMDQQLSGGKRKLVEFGIGANITEMLKLCFVHAWDFWNDVQNLIFAYHTSEMWLAHGQVKKTAEYMANMEKLKKRIAELRVTQAREAAAAEAALATAGKLAEGY